MEVPDDDFVSFQCQTGNGRFVLGLKDAPRLIQVNAKAAAVLEDLYKLDNVFATFYITQTSLKKFLEASAKDSEATHIEKLLVNANIYGSRDTAADISAILSDNGMFLQNPIWRNDELVYENPHELPVQGVTDEQIWFETLSLDAEAYVYQWVKGSHRLRQSQESQMLCWPFVPLCTSEISANPFTHRF